MKIFFFMRIVFIYFSPFLQLPCQGNVFQVFRTYRQFVQHATCKVSWRGHIKTLMTKQNSFNCLLDLWTKSKMSRVANKGLAVPSIFFWSLFSNPNPNPNLTPKQCIVGKPGHESDHVKLLLTAGWFVLSKQWFCTHEQHHEFGLGVVAMAFTISLGEFD